MERDTLAQKLLATAMAGCVRVHAYPSSFDPMKPFDVAAGSGSGIGTGFIINKQLTANHMLVLTCAHCVNECRSDAVSVIFPQISNEEQPAHVLSVCPEYDLAVLVTKKAPNVVEFVLEPAYPGVGSDVFALGFSLGMAGMSVTRGIFSGMQDGRFQHTASINQGCSGGPAVNAAGRVIGVNSSGVLAAQQVGFAQPARYFLNVRPHMLKQRAQWHDAAAVVRVGDLGLMYHRMLPVARNFAGGAGINGVIAYHVHTGSAFRDLIAPGTLVTAIEMGGAWYDIDSYGDVHVPGVKQPMALLHCIYHRNAIDGEVRLRYEEGDQTRVTPPRKLLPPARGTLLWQPQHPFDARDFARAFGCTVTALTLAHLRTEVGAKLIMPMTPDEMDLSQLFVTHIVPGCAVAKQRAIRVGHIIKSVDDTPVDSVAAFRDAIRDATGTHITLRAKHGATVRMERDRFITEERQMAEREPNYVSAAL